MLHSSSLLLLTLAAFSIFVKSRGDDCFVLSASDYNKDTGLLACPGNGQTDTVCKSGSNTGYGISHTVTKSNEGNYSCCCGTCDSNVCTPTTTYYAPPSPADTTIQTLIKHEWGQPIEIQCPIRPGVLYETYKFDWSLIRDTVTFSLLDQPDVTLNKTTNTLIMNSFTSFFEGEYTCFSTNGEGTNQGSAEVNVTIQNSSNSNSITQQPAPMHVNDNGTAQLQCAATVRGNESMGFRVINSTDNSTVIKNITTIDGSCELSNSLTNVICDEDRYMLICDYSIPYQINCTLKIKELSVTESSFVECFIFVDVTNDIVNSRTGLFVIPGPSQTPTAHLYYKVGGLMFELVLAYPLTLSPITIEVIIGDETYSKTALLSTDNRRLTADFDVSVTMTTQVEYKILFDGSSLIQSSVVLNIATPTSIPSTTNSILPTSTLTTVTTETTMTSMLSTSDGIVPTAEGGSSLNKEALNGIVGGAAFFVLCILLAVIFIAILLVNHSISKKKKTSKYNFEQTPEGGGIGPESCELLPPTVGYVTHLSPDHIRSDSYSQVSTIDTYVDEQSPRHPPPSQSSRSSHSHSSNSCPSTHNLRQKPLPRYGIPDHYPQFQPINQQYSLPLTSLPEITLITPTPTMENQPVLGDYPDCRSPTGTEPFSSPNTPLEENKECFSNKENSQNRPSNLPIGAPLLNESGGTTPLSDQTMIGVLLYLQHKDCNNRINCQTCKLIDRHFERIANKYGDTALTGIIKNLNTPGADGTLKHLRKREKRDKQRIRSPHKPQVAPLGFPYKRQRSHSASHIDDEELTFSSTETDEDSLKPSNRRFKPLLVPRKAVTDDERDDYDYHHHRLLPLQRINEGFSLSQHDIPSTPLDFTGISHLPGKSTSETDSTDGSTSSRSDSNPRFDSSKKSGLSASYMRSPDVEESLPVEFLSKVPVASHQPSTTSCVNSSSGYETDNVFFQDRKISSSSDSTMYERPPVYSQSVNGPVYPQSHGPVYSQSQSVNGPVYSQSVNGPVYSQSQSVNGPVYSMPNYPYNDGRQAGYSDDNNSLKSASLSYKGNQSNSQSDYLKIAARRGSQEKSNLSLNSMHSSPDRYYNRNTSNGSNHSNHSVHSESALHYHPKTHSHKFYSPPQQRRNKNGRTPSPIQLLLPSEESSATPI